jgi:zinc protease
MRQFNQFLPRRYSALVFAITVLLFACATSVSKLDNSVFADLGLPSAQVPLVQKLRRGVLPNGLRYYLLNNARPENRAYLTLAVHAVSVLEEDDEQGLAHFVEHLAFNGTSRFPEQDIIDYLRSLGMRFGPDVNAYTSYDETVYGIEVPVERDADGVKSIPEKALHIMDDWMHAVLFNPKDVDEERPVVLEEKRMRRNAMSRLRERMLSLIYHGSPYAERIPIGLTEVIENAPASALENFYKKWYRPDNMALIIVGDFDDAQLESSLSSYFTAPSSAPDALSRPVYDLPAPKKGQLDVSILTDPELAYTVAYLYYKRQPKALDNTLASYREGLIDSLIGTMFNERFSDEVSNPDTPYVSAAGFSHRLAFSSRYYVLGAQAKTNNVEDAIKAVLVEKERLIRYGFTDDEIERAKKELLSGFEQEVAEKDRLPSSRYVQDFTSDFLYGYTTADIEWEFAAAQKLLPLISSKELADAARSYFIDDDLSVFILGPESEKLPSPDQVKKIVKDAKKARVEKPKQAAVSDELIAQAPLSGSIAAETTDSAAGALVWELSNGAQVILKQTENQNDEIILYALAKGGITSAREEDIISVKLAATMLAVSGAGPYPQQELSKKLAGKQAGLSFWVNSYLRGFNGASSVKDVKTLFEVLYLIFTQPRFDDPAIRAMLSQYETSLVNQDKSPESVFSKEVLKSGFGNNPYFNPLEISDLATVDQAVSLQFIKKSLNPADYTFVLVGNIDIATIRSYVEQYVASIPRDGQRWNTWDDPHVIRPHGLNEAFYQGKEDKSLVYLAWTMPETYSEGESAAASVLSDYLDIIFSDRIREKQGGTYSVASNVSLSPFPAHELVMGIYFSCDPKRVTELIASISGELAAIANGSGIDAIKFAQAKEALIKSWETSLQDNQYLSRSYANSVVLYNTDLSRMDRIAALYEAVTIRDIQEMTDKLLQTKPFQAVLYPEK